MMQFVFCLLLLMLLVVGCKFAAAVFSVLLWFFCKLPIAMALWSFGVVCVCSILLIPVGLWMFSLGSRILFSR